MRQIGDEASRFCFQPIDRRRRRDVESPVVFIAPSQIRRLLGHGDGAEMIPFGIPNPNAFRARDEQVSIFVDFDAVRDAFVLSAWFFAENAPVGQNAVGCDIVDANVFLRAVIDVELLAVGRKSEPVRLSQVFRQQLDGAFVVESVHALKRDLLLLSSNQVQRRIGEIEGPLRPNNYVIGAVEFLAFVVVGENGIFSVSALRQ